MLATGHIYFLQVRVFNPPKSKYLALAYLSPEDKVRFFVVNSKRTPLQKRQAELRLHLISLPKGTHNFLGHDSWLDCSELIGGWTGAELRTKIDKDPSIYICKLNPNILAQVRKVVSDSRILSARDKALIMAQWPL